MLLATRAFAKFARRNCFSCLIFLAAGIKLERVYEDIPLANKSFCGYGYFLQ